ncbi:MAG TPA: protein kinase [Streptosporangiaceae bacterium]|nr:protein kinase [Streptosporangiaceae bacterium]
MNESVPPGTNLRPGALVAGYRLEERIGRGGMAVVFRAVDERLDRPVALKILSPGMTADNAFRVRFINESRAAAAVEHPHIIPVYEAGEAGGMLFIAMRYVRGGDARSLLRRIGPLPADRALGIISQVAAALDAAHRRGLVHRDVKPGNMLLDVSRHLAGAGPADHVYLTDFGISKQAQSAGLTVTGQIVGTLDYAAPEQIEGREVDGRTDLYSLACSVFELLGGTPPFRRSQGPALIYAHLSTAPPPLTASRPDLPAAADRVIAKAMAKTAAERYATCSEFAADLGRALRLIAGRVEAVGHGLLPPVASTKVHQRPKPRPEIPEPAQQVKPVRPTMPPGGLARPPGTEPPTRKREP